MSEFSSQEVTHLLIAWREGEKDALDKLIPLVYEELRHLAHNYMRGERKCHTLQTTALVNEAYLKLLDCSRVNWQNRAHFLAITAQLMRRILVDYARSKRSYKRGGAAERISLDEFKLVSRNTDPDLIEIDEALESLKQVDARKCQVVELRFFGGMTAEETAEVLDISPDTVLRDWKFSRAWLAREMKQKVLG
ncbi:MAG: sigma-70 family RNA polymerase sigma factor [Desulfatiglans sp.]|jgi:RNA polymerase sigma factor (TIGR02999 family)|nr:sigma-70 family RNA polymerase sigma factor [Desulfatiglans sp.]